MNHDRKKRLIVVLGMHRSGTSAITRGLKALGVELGENLMPAAAGINEKGFWEDLDVYRFNNELLHFLGYEWHTLEPIQRSEYERDDVVSFKLRAVELLREKLKNTTIFGLKDPRIARLMPFWKIVFADLGVDVGYIIAIRHPLSVAYSLNKRDGFELEKSSYLWLGHVIPSMLYSEGCPRLVVDYDLLMKQREKQIRRISRAFGLPFDTSAPGINEYINDFLTEDLCHASFRIDDLELEPHIPQPVVDTYIFLDEIAKDNVSESSKEVHAHFAELSRYLEGMRPALSYMTRGDEKAARLNEDVGERDARIAGLEQSVGERDARIAGLEQSVGERDVKIGNLARALENRDQAVVDRDLKIARLNSHIVAIQRSTSWKLTYPLRYLGKIIRDKYLWSQLIRHKLTDARRVMRGVVNMSNARKAIWVFRHRGLRGIKAGVMHLFATHFHQRQSDAAPIQSVDDMQTRQMPITGVDIDAYDTFVLDVFDTAIIRLVRYPVDVFWAIEVEEGIRKFKSHRIEAEKQARNENIDRKDVSLESIYEESEHCAADLEKSYEAKFCVANPDLYRFYCRLVSAKKKIYFASDMYLSKPTIEEILNKCGYKIYDGVFVSSEDNLIKGDGSRFAWIKSHLNVEANKAIHIGDNLIADYHQPIAHGFHAFHYITPDIYFSIDSLIGTQKDFLERNLTLGISVIMGIYRYWKSGFCGQEPAFWRQFGFFYGGALVYNFCHFLRRTILDEIGQDCERYFLARDGDIIKQSYDVMFGSDGNHYLLASRRCMSFPAISDVTISSSNAVIDLYCVVEPETTSQDIFARFAYPELDKLRSDLETEEIRNGMLSSNDVLKCLNNYRKEILNKSSEERAMLTQYLETAGFFDHEKCVVVDVGWGGTIQDCLDKVAELVHPNPPKTLGIYLGVRPGAMNRERKHGYLFNGKNSKFNIYLDLIELITSSPTDSVLSVCGNASTGFHAVTAPETQDEKQRKEVSAEIQRGIMDFVRIAQRNYGSTALPVEVTDFSILFDGLALYGCDQVRSKVSSLKHARMLVGPHDRPVMEFVGQ